MTNEFLQQNCVSPEIAKSLKEIGFNEECVGFYSTNGEVEEFMYYDTDRTNSALATVIEYYNTASTVKEDCTAPLFQQVFDWFERKYIFPTTHIEIIDNSKWIFSYRILFIPKEYQNQIGKGKHFHEVSSYSHYPTPTSKDGWGTNKEAQIACIQKMIEVFKEQNNENDISHEEYEQNRINQLKTDGLF